ncbi:MAG: hypothetical protein H6741_11565 [Alphaproteobacteria bacterium]|nr:hypothetical protein [Alphaproteobacteria bacterium]
MLLLLVSLAFAQETEFYLETPTVAARGELSALMDVAEEAGWSARVVRRYELGEGWTYALVVEDFDDAEAAQDAATRLAEIGGMGVAVYRREGRSGVRVSADWPEDQGPGGREPGALPPADEILLRAVRALGGREGGSARLAQSPAVRFNFEREVAGDAGPIRARHSYLRADKSLRLEIEILDGEGQSSLTVVGSEGAWVRTEAGVVARDPGRASELLEAFAPEQILNYPMRFASLVASDPAHDALRTVALREDLQRPCYQLEDGEGLGVCVDSSTWHPVEVSLDSGAGLVRYHYRDWREIDTGLVMPFEVEMQRDGAVIERVRVTEISLLGEVEAALFTAPAAE